MANSTQCRGTTAKGRPCENSTTNSNGLCGQCKGTSGSGGANMDAPLDHDIVLGEPDHSEDEDDGWATHNKLVDLDNMTAGLEEVLLSRHLLPEEAKAICEVYESLQNRRDDIARQSRSCDTADTTQKKQKKAYDCAVGDIVLLDGTDLEDHGLMQIEWVSVNRDGSAAFTVRHMAGQFRGETTGLRVDHQHRFTFHRNLPLQTTGN